MEGDDFLNNMFNTIGYCDVRTFIILSESRNTSRWRLLHKSSFLELSQTRHHNAFSSRATLTLEFLILLIKVYFVSWFHAAWLRSELPI